MDFVGATLPQFDQLLGTMRLSSGGPGLPGSIFQWSRRTSDGVRVTQVWNSYRHFEDFLDREEIALRLSEAGIREPEITTYEVTATSPKDPPSSRTKMARIGTPGREGVPPTASDPGPERIGASWPRALPRRAPWRITYFRVYRPPRRGMLK